VPYFNYELRGVRGKRRRRRRGEHEKGKLPHAIKAWGPG
jgi:hypothetical protein